MKLRKTLLSAGFVAALALCCAVDNGFAQGRGRGGGGGNGGGNGGGQPAGVGNSGGGMGGGHGVGNTSSRPADDRFGTKSTTVRPVSPADRARHAHATANRMSDNDLNRYRGLSRKLGTTPEQMRDAYAAALVANPNLNYGQFVAANVVADNLGGRFPNITSSNILAGLASGDSLGQTLRNLGMTKEQSKIAQRDAEDRINTAKNRNR